MSWASAKCKKCNSVLLYATCHVCFIAPAWRPEPDPTTRALTSATEKAARYDALMALYIERQRCAQAVADRREGALDAFRRAQVALDDQLGAWAQEEALRG